MPDAIKLQIVSDRLHNLSDVQLDIIDDITRQLAVLPQYDLNPQSDFINDGMLWGLGDTLRIHHCFSAEAFTKDRFEHALERSANINGVKAARAARGNPGQDLTINGVNFSLKSEARADIKIDFAHISKFMELGRGTWSDQIEQLDGLRDQMFRHMNSYDRITMLRRLTPRFKDGNEHYELVEIPKALLLESATGVMKMMTNSVQSPKPGSCQVLDKHGKLKFELYFDGGTERKLQIKHIRKSLCIVHATWVFPAYQPIVL